MQRKAKNGCELVNTYILLSRRPDPEHKLKLQLLDVADRANRAGDFHVASYWIGISFVACCQHWCARCSLSGRPAGASAPDEGSSSRSLQLDRLLRRSERRLER